MTSLFQPAPSGSRFAPYVEIVLPLIPIALLAALSVFALYRFVIPQLS
jgi:hypothetical protein